MSNLIKSSFYLPQEDIKTIEAAKPKRNYIKPSKDQPEAVEAVQEQGAADLEETGQLREQIVRDAEKAALDIIGKARAEADKLLDQSREEIGKWWEERRLQDEQTVEQARQTGYEAGYGEGESAARHQVLEQHSEMIKEARTILEQAYELQRQIVREAEPFLIEMSVTIAGKIISRQLDTSEDWVKDMIKQTIKRCNEKGTIALCVAPGQFAYIQSVREELSYLVDAQAVLHIYPDASVEDHGCVIKTSFGSIDARVETQLTEIKRALLDAARRGDDAADE